VLAQKLYIYTVFCEVTTLRLDGIRLRPGEWPTPIRGRIVIVQHGGRAMASRRSMRSAELLTDWGTTPVPTLHMFEPEVVDVVGDALLFRGYVVKSCREDQRCAEYQQLWLVRPCMSMDAPPLAPFDPSKWVRRLPVEECAGNEQSSSAKWLAAHPVAADWKR